MRLAKPGIDVGLSTNQGEAHLAFWRDRIGLAFDAHLAIGRGHEQHRFHAEGSIVKVNVFADPLPDRRGGYREVMIAREAIGAPRRFEDPDGSLVSLVPVGFEGVRQLGIRLAVRDLRAHRRFYADALGFAEEQPGRFRAGDTLILIEEDRDALPDAGGAGIGWRYVTLQVFKADPAHARALAMGASEARAPATLGDVARFSIVRDPDGNAIELSQRASIVGSLD